MPHADIVAVINGWQEVYQEEGEAIRKMQKDLKGGEEGYVQIFEVGSVVMPLTPEPRSYDGLLCAASARTGLVDDIVSENGSQADSSVPDEPYTELSRFQDHLKTHGSHLLLSYAQFEVEKQERVVCIDEASGWVAVVPFWATWPYELLGG